MRIIKHVLTHKRKHAYASGDFHVDVPGNLHHSRYPVVPGTGQPAWGWGGRWV